MSTLISSDAQSSHLTDDLDERFRCLVKHAICAPSGHNTQPWLFRREADYLDVIADRTRGLPVVDPNDRELTMSCGAALDHMQVAARHYGWKLDCDMHPDTSDTDVLARVYAKSSVPPDSSERGLFDAIQSRRTNRSSFDSRPLPLELRDRCVRFAQASGIELSFITDVDKRTAVAELVAEGDRIQFSDVRFRRELASWVHSRRSATKDGMSGAGFGMPDVLSPIGALVIRSFDIGNGVAASDKDKIVEGSPTLAVLSSPDDSVAHWLTTGQVLSRVLLMLESEGAAASYLNPPIEVDKLRPRLRGLLGCRGQPQLVMRFGYGPEVEPTVRREVYDVMLTNNQGTSDVDT